MARSDFQYFESLKIRYAEIDAQGIVFNAHYLTFIDTAVYGYLKGLGFDLVAYVESTGRDFHTLHAELDYLAPSRFGDILEVAVRTAKIGNSSLTFRIEIFGRGESEARVEAALVWVHADVKAGKSLPVPVEIRECIMAFEGRE